ncbi:hypothetical protein Patl1_10969 [Pistacia atlantica]|uniref:Uncharacterized protein n=1 Tax=Pistacia atlantica TaxID=434234 RepID=A0ACC1A5T2_9ROSI|nr:hypothetical protein Patl1_10969 [Pistacia atlantica]
MLNVDYSKQIDLINYTFVMNDNEIYYAISTKNDSPFSIAVLEPTGVMKRMFWLESKKWVNVWMVPVDFCDEYSRCGANAICHNEDTMTRCECLPRFEPLYPHEWNLECAEKRKVEPEFSIAAANARKNSKKFLANKSTDKSTVAFIIVPVVMEMLIIATCFYYWWTRKGNLKNHDQLNIFFSLG